MSMKNENSSAASSAIDLPTLLTVAFVVLKLCHVIDWSWWWVLSPTLIELSIVIIVLVVYIWHEVAAERKWRRAKREDV